MMHTHRSHTLIRHARLSLWQNIDHWISQRKCHSLHSLQIYFLSVLFSACLILTFSQSVSHSPPSHIHRHSMPFTIFYLNLFQLENIDRDLPLHTAAKGRVGGIFRSRCKRSLTIMIYFSLYKKTLFPSRRPKCFHAVVLEKFGSCGLFAFGSRSQWGTKVFHSLNHMQAV